MQRNPMQYIDYQCSTLKCETTLYNAIERNTTQYYEILGNTMLYNATYLLPAFVIIGSYVVIFSVLSFIAVCLVFIRVFDFIFVQNVFLVCTFKSLHF